MQLWMDGDACPKPIKDIIFRAVMRTGIMLTVVSNHRVPTPISVLIKTIQVPGGFDVADQYIVDHMQKLDLVITADIPLADEVVTKGGLALNPRGELYSVQNIKQHLNIRNQNESLRSSGLISGGPKSLSAKEIQCFANQLDKWLTVALRSI